LLLDLDVVIAVGGDVSLSILSVRSRAVGFFWRWLCCWLCLFFVFDGGGVCCGSSMIFIAVAVVRVDWCFAAPFFRLVIALVVVVIVDGCLVFDVMSSVARGFLKTATLAG
jgi:hypothetical protein